MSTRSSVSGAQFLVACYASNMLPPMYQYLDEILSDDQKAEAINRIVAMIGDEDYKDIEKHLRRLSMTLILGDYNGT